MVRLATDALAVACILAGGAAGTAITLAALDDGPRSPLQATEVTSHAVVSVSGIGMSGGPCVAARAPRVVVTTSDDASPRELRAGEVRRRAVRGRAVIAATTGECREIDRASLERHRSRLEAARVEVEASRAQVESMRRQLEREIRVERHRERRR